MYGMTIIELLDSIEKQGIQINGRECIVERFKGDLTEQDTAIAIRRVISALLDTNGKVSLYFEMTKQNLFSLGSRLSTIGFNDRESIIIFQNLKSMEKVG
jgi:hypothetical protein